MIAPERLPTSLGTGVVMLACILLANSQSACTCAPFSSKATNSSERPQEAIPDLEPTDKLSAQSLAIATVPPQFVVTADSDEWVRESFQVQDRYDRLIVVDAASTPARAVRVPPLALNARTPMPAQEPEQIADLVVATLQQAVDASRGGDLIAVMPGTYAGFVMGKRPGAGQGRYIRMVALGPPGAVKITSPMPGADDPRWMAYFKTAQYVIFEGFHLVGTSQPGAPAPNTPWAGVFVDGNFGESGEMAHHIALIRLLSHHHFKWGMHSTDSHTVLMQDSLYGFAGKEHSAYVSDGSDNYVIRRNIFLGSNAAGLQCNMDSHASLNELVKHPSMQHLAPVEHTRAWVEKALREATQRFGAGNFPDGRGVNFLIEENVVNGNGRAGASGFNFASMSLSLVQNNLIYGNFASGIAQWDDGNAFDKPYREPGPTDPATFRGPQELPMFGCQNNVIRHNTVLLSTPTRPALQARNGSWGMRAYNNILINDTAPSLHIFNTSTYNLDTGHNIVHTIDYVAPSKSVLGLASTLPENNRTVTGYNQARLATELVGAGHEPWAVLEGDWWALNPKRPDFRPLPTSHLLVGQAFPGEIPPRDLTGKQRTTGAIGALEP